MNSNPYISRYFTEKPLDVGKSKGINSLYAGISSADSNNYDSSSKRRSGSRSNQQPPTVQALRQLSTNLFGSPNQPR